jgi:TM2 domain-containing membrane protein YozV
VTPEEPTVTDPGPSTNRDDEQFPQSPFSDEFEKVQNEGGFQADQQSGNPGGYPQQAGYPQQGAYPQNAYVVPGYAQPGYPGGAYPAQGYAGPGFPPNVPVSPKTKIVGALLAFFLGSLGAHNFYFGKTGKAVAQLVMTVVGWVGLIVGFVCIGAGIDANSDWVTTSSGYGYYRYDDNDGLIGLGVVLLIAAGLLITAVAIWAFVEFIMILSGARTYQFDQEGRLVQ